MQYTTNFNLRFINVSSFIRWFTFLCFFLFQQHASGQSEMSFTYEGSSGGKIKVQYFLRTGGRDKKLETNVIDLNNHSRNVMLVVELSGLEVGLNKRAKKMRNSGHYRQYYMKAFHRTSKLLNPVDKGAKKIGAKIANYGELKQQLIYRISPVTTQRRATVKIGTQIINADNPGEKWPGVSISKSLTLLPRDSDIANNEWRPVKKLWTTFDENPTEEHKKMLLEKSLEYLRNCEDGVGSCHHKEDALFYIINTIKDKELEKYIDKYNEAYPKGQYKDKIIQIRENQEEEVQVATPVEEGARLDFDNNYLLINGVRGGQMPYWLQFFDDQKQDSIAIDNSYSFSKDYEHVDLESINVPEGNYKVVVTDSNGSEIVAESGIYIRKAITIHPSVKIGGILLLLGGIAFAYKKYIHF